MNENINLKTNRLAKKQLTWFKQEDRIKIVDSDDEKVIRKEMETIIDCLLYTSPSPRDPSISRMPSSA